MKKEKKMRKSDWMLFGTVLLIAVLIYGMHNAAGDERSGYVSVKINGEVVQSVELTEDRKIELNGGTNVIEIKDGKVSMIEADCPDQLCVHQKAISKNNESIICLPNRVILQIESRDEAEIDAVAN